MAQNSFGKLKTKSPKSILVVSESKWAEGVVYDLHIIAEGLASIGHSVCAIDPGTPKNVQNPSGAVKRLKNSKAGVLLFSPKLPEEKERNLLQKCFYYFAKYRIRKDALSEVLTNVKPDIIILYSAVRLGPECVLIARRLGIPVVFRNVDKLYNLWGKKSLRLIALLRERRTYKLTQRLMALTPNYGEYMSRLGADQNLISIVPFPIDIEEFSPRRPNIPMELRDLFERARISSRTFNIVFVGTFYEFGGLFELVSSFPKVIKGVQNAKLILVGDGPIKVSLQERINDLGLENQVIITGYRPFSEMPDLINLSSICVNAFPINRRTSDIFSAKIIQYLACDKTVISSRLPGIENAISSDNSGVIYVDSVDDIYAKITELVNQNGSSRVIGRKGRDYVLKHHSYNVVLTQVENVIQDIDLGNKNAS
jgi:glycosyltransferase involved in cell wall biosynthesis